jgi:hypothetical protein
MLLFLKRYRINSAREVNIFLTLTMAAVGRVLTYLVDFVPEDQKG